MPPPRFFSRLPSSLQLYARLPLTTGPRTGRARFNFTTSAAAMATEFKVKGLTSLNLKNGDKQEVEIEGVEGGKALVMKFQNEIVRPPYNSIRPNRLHC